MTLYEKLNAIMSEVNSLQKDSKIAFGNTKYNYLSEAKTTSIFHEKFVKYKVVLLPIETTEHINGNVTHGIYKYRLIDAENPTDYIDLMSAGQGHDSADKGSGKASSYAYKYLLWRMFAIPSNDDPDQVSSDEIREVEAVRKKKIDKNKQTAITELAKEVGADIEMMLSYFEIDNIKNMTESQAVEAFELLEKKRKPKK